MTGKEIVRRLLRHWPLLLLIPFTTAASVYFFSRFQDRKYRSDTVIYTGIASGYKIEGGNNGSGSNWSATATAFDNLISLINSRDTRDEVCLRLLAWRLLADASTPARPLAAQQSEGLLTRASRKVLTPKPTPFDQLLTPALKTSLTGRTLEETAARLIAYYKTNNTNAVYKLVNSKDPLFSTTALYNISAMRLKDSDLVQIEYTIKDPLVCQKTLEILTDVAIRKHKELFTGQNESVIGYFNDAAKKAYDRLQTAEQRLLAFQRKHNIADYEKQLISSTDERQAATDKLNQLEMQYAGTTSTLKSVENTLDNRGDIKLNNEVFIRLRNRLGALNAEASELEIANNTDHSASTRSRLATVNQEIAQVTQRLDAATEGNYNMTHSTKGVEVKGLLNDYSKGTLAAADLKSQLRLMRRQKAEAASEYNQLVPLSAEVRKIRREVEVAEKEYLSQMEGLKQSKLSQQNGVLASQLRVVDPPYLPVDPTGSKTLLLLLGGFIGAFLLTGAGVVATGLLDTSLQHPAQATKTTSFPVAGVVPKVPNPTPPQQLLVKQAEDHLARQLLLRFHEKKNTLKPYTIGVLSSQSSEGKTSIACNLAASLNDMGIRTLSMFPDDHTFQIIPNDDTMFYSPLRGLAQGVAITDLTGKDLYPDEVVIIEFPALLETTYPVSLLQDLDLILAAVRAERAWHEADRTVFTNIQKVTKAPIELVLNGVLPEYVIDFIGKRVRPHAPSYNPALPAHPAPALLN